MKPHYHRSRQGSRHSSRQGSALLMTLLVVSLLLLIVVAFSIFVRMELRQVINQQQLLQARASARLAANLAVASLQEAAGHDQRITLPAWSDRDVPLTIPYENRFFTGIRDAREFVYEDQGGSPTLVKNPDYGLHQGWMVSSGSGFDINTPQFSSSFIGVQVAMGSVLMVGPGSSDPTLDTNGNGVPDDYVAVPLENVNNSAGVSQQIGYFVMDEGTKAKLNQFDPFPTSSTPEYSRLMAQQAAVALVLPGFDAGEETQRQAVGKIFSDPQWELFEEMLAGPQSQTAYQRFFHAITSYSLGLPVNVKSGGLKKDLTAIAEQLGSADVDTTTAPYTDLLAFHESRLLDRLEESLIYQGEGDFLTPVQKGLPLRASQVNTTTRHKVFPPSSYASTSVVDPGGPQWRQLLSFLNMGERLYDSNSGVLDAAVHSDEGHGTPPVMSRFHLRVQFSLTEDNGDYLVGFHLIPNIALWNPYDVPLRIPETYVFQNLSFNKSGGLPLHLRVRHPSWHGAGESYWMPAHHISPMGRFNEGIWSSFPLMMKIPETVFQPGESIWFELEDHVEMPFAATQDGERGGGFSYFMMDDDQDGTLGNSRYPSVMELDMRNTDHYALMKPGLDSGGSKSIFLQENLTWRTKSEAGAYARRVRSDWGSEPTAFARSNDTVRLQPDVANGFLWRSWENRWVSPWKGNSRTPTGVPRYPLTFQYALVDDPGTLIPFSFTPYVDGGGKSGYEYGNITGVDGLPVRANRRDNGTVVNTVNPAGSGNPKLDVDAPLYNPWLRREENPNSWPELWKNKKIFPVTFNENGIIYSFGADDPSVPESIAVDKQGITTDWQVLEIRLAAGHENYRSNNPSSDWPSSSFGRGAMLMGPDPTEFVGLQSQNTRPKVFMMAFNTSPAWPSSLLGDPWDPAYPGPKWTSLPSWNGSDGFIEGVTGDSFGIVFALRSPEHGMTGDDRVVYQIPWLTGYNPLATYLAGDPLFQTDENQFHKLGSGGPVTWVGGVTEDPDLLDPMRWTPDDRTSSIGHSYEAFNETRTVLKQIPRSIEEFTSIGQLMHANPVSMGPARMVSGRPVDHAQTYYPYKDGFRQSGGEYVAAYAIGGGSVSEVIDPRLPFRFAWSEDPNFPESDLTNYIDQQTLVETGATAVGYNGFHAVPNGPREYYFFPTYDHSFYLNNALWDDYMFTGAANGRLRWENGVVDRDFDLSASRVLMEGAFNINSASPGAWAALLASHLDMDIPIQGGGTDSDTDYRVPMMRVSDPVDTAFTGDGAQDYYSGEFYGGFRRLRPNDIYDRENGTGLAVEIVRAIAERGPFTSLADFVNRDPGATSSKYPNASASQLEEYRRSSPLQMAINRSGINGTGFGVHDSSGTSIIRASEDFTGNVSDGTPIHFWRHTENVEELPSNLGAPGTLIQQDILSRIGGFIQVRSDTFKIRAYGNVFNQVTGERAAQAWCEVVVQRKSEYVDDVDTPDVRTADLTSPINQWLGRRFEILSFRWLSPEEI